MELHAAAGTVERLKQQAAVLIAGSPGPID